MPDWLLPMIVTIINGVIGYFLKRHMDRVDGLAKDLNAHKSLTADEIKEMRQELTDLQLRIPHQYVMRDDWIRYQSAFETKLDRIGQDVRDRMDKMNDHVDQKVEKIYDLLRQSVSSGGDD